MTPEQKKLVRDSFALIAPAADHTGKLFYDNLFRLDPSLRQLFHGNIGEQSGKLMQMLATAVYSLDNLESLGPALHALGRRHAVYGVQPAQFDTVATALLATLETGLGARFTEPVREAWVAAYTLLASTIKRGVLTTQGDPAMNDL
jgi:hemoglobin-like flavoprotein